MKQIFLNNLKIHDLADSTCKFMVESPVEGLEAPSVSTSSFNKSGMDGIYVTNQFRRERRITLRGQIIATSTADLKTQRQLLLAALAPSKTNTILDNKVMSFTTLDDSEYRINVQILAVKMPIENITNSSFLIDILATDSNIQGEDLHTETIQTRSGGGHAVPYVLPVVFEGGVGGSIVINNAGDADSYPTVRLYGPLTNPRIENQTTGKWISLTLSIEAGSYIEIDMENRTIIQGDMTNRIGVKSDDSRFWYLAPGDNTIVLSSSVQGEAGYAEVIFRDNWNGL